MVICAVSPIYYGVKQSPLNEHRDVCPVIRINIRFRFPSGLLARKWLYKELRLPVKEGIGHVSTTIGKESAPYSEYSLGSPKGKVKLTFSL
jgi:hypothetical protein